VRPGAAVRHVRAEPRGAADVFAALQQAARGAARERAARARLLAAAVDILLAVGDLEQARAALPAHELSYQHGVANVVEAVAEGRKGVLLFSKILFLLQICC